MKVWATFHDSTVLVEDHEAVDTGEVNCAWYRDNDCSSSVRGKGFLVCQPFLVLCKGHPCELKDLVCNDVCHFAGVPGANGRGDVVNDEL